MEYLHGFKDPKIKTHSETLAYKSYTVIFEDLYLERNHFGCNVVEIFMSIFGGQFCWIEIMPGLRIGNKLELL